jgi:hypothetical protein
MDRFAQLPAAERAIVFRETAARLRVGWATIVEKDFWVCWALHRIFSSTKRVSRNNLTGLPRQSAVP